MTKVLRAFALIVVTLATFLINGVAFAAQDWTAVPAACAGTDNNFYSGAPSGAFPVARFIVPGGRLSFNASHIGYIAVVCNLENPTDLGTNPAWDRLEVTYIDPDGVHDIDVHFGTNYQVLAQLIRINRVSGIESAVAEFDSNNDCLPASLFCDGTSVRTFAKPFAHTFDFANNAYAVYGRLFRSVVDPSKKPVPGQRAAIAAPLSRQGRRRVVA
jgi:hypothetical protein